MSDWIDCTPPVLSKQGFCARLLFWPCDSTVACTNACSNCDCLGVCTVLFCCPCRTFCGWCPTNAESVQQQQQDPHPEPDEIPYSRVFEMEQKKRKMLKAQVS